MQPMYYIGLDVHKRKISYCVKDGSGRIDAEGSISTTRLEQKLNLLSSRKKLRQQMEVWFYLE